MPQTKAVFLLLCVCPVFGTNGSEQQMSRHTKPKYIYIYLSLSLPAETIWPAEVWQSLQQEGVALQPGLRTQLML